MAKEEKLNKIESKQALETAAKQEEKEAEKEAQKTAVTEDHKDHKHEEKAPAVKKREEGLERLYTVSLFKAYRKPAPKRANTAIKMLREYIARHAKAELENAKIDAKVQSFIMQRGHTKPAKSV